MAHTIKDGTRVIVRPIRPGDKTELSAALGRLSDASVQRRFLSPKPSLSAAELRYLTEVDGHRHAALVAELEDHPGQIVAVGRYVSLADEPGTAEVAFVVGDPLQGLGLGSLLAEHLAREAVGHGIRRFSATMASDNHAAHRLMRHLTDQLERRHQGFGAQELVADLPSAA